MLRLLILLCLIGPLSVLGQSCSYSYILGSFTWTEGRDQCINDGMDIAVIKDQETQAEVNFYINTNGWTNDIWMGLLWHKIYYSFEWIDNEQLGPWTNWDPSEPDCMESTEAEPLLCRSSYNQNCVRIQRLTASWVWKTHACHNFHSVLCQSCTDTTIASSISPKTVESATALIPYSLNTPSNKLSTDGRMATTAETLIEHDNLTTEGYTDNSKNELTDYNKKSQNGHHVSSFETTTPTLNTSTLGKDNCKSKFNSCHCQRKMSNTTESVKISDYIWLRKCEVQPLIESGVLKVIDCPFTCSCSPRDPAETNSATHEMFACIKRR